MFFVDTVEVQGLGNRGYLAGGRTAAVVIDPPRDIDRVIAAAALRGVRISHVVETHVHDDYVSGGHELARITGAAYVVPQWVRDGERPAALARAVFADLGELPANAVLLDVRRTTERASAGHIEGSRHIPLHELRGRIREIPLGAPVWVHCAGGLRASVAASLLASTGHEVVAIDDSFDNAPVAPVAPVTLVASGAAAERC